VTRDELAHIGEGSARAAHQALPWARVVRSPNFWAILLMYHAYCWGSYFYVSWMPTYLRLGRGFTADEMKIYAMLPFLAGAIGNLTGGAVSDVLVRRIGLKVGRRAVAATGLAMSALCLFGTAVVDNRLLAVAFLTFGYFSMDCMLPVSWAVCVDVGKRHAGAMTGAMNTAGQFGSFLSSIAFGALVDAFGGRYDVPLILFSACLALSALIFLRIDASKPLMDDVAI
jgi:MFS transporter, ACS family, glucarate transporter